MSSSWNWQNARDARDQMNLHFVNAIEAYEEGNFELAQVELVAAEGEASEAASCFNDLCEEVFEEWQEAEAEADD